MCELLGMSCRHPASIDLSLTALAGHGRPGGPNADGWGVGYLEAGDVRLFRDLDPAGASDWLDAICDHHLTSRATLAHIRHATQGGRTLANTQPFARELGGRMHLFAHNGDLTGLDPAGLGCHRPIGETDSERAFCLLLARLEPLWLGRDGPPPVAARVEVFVDLMRELRPLGPANVLYSDGELLLAHGHRRTHGDGRIRPPGLHLLARACPAAGGQVCGAGVTLTSTADHQQVQLFASVPLSPEPWIPLGEGEVAVASAGRELARIPA